VSLIVGDDERDPASSVPGRRSAADRDLGAVQHHERFTVGEALTCSAQVGCRMKNRSCAVSFVSASW
jgi:hypothetical protein